MLIPFNFFPIINSKPFLNVISPGKILFHCHCCFEDVAQAFITVSKDQESMLGCFLVKLEALQHPPRWNPFCTHSPPLSPNERSYNLYLLVAGRVQLR